MGVTEEQNGWG